MAPLTVAVGEARPGETAPRRKAAQRDAPVERPADSSATTMPEFIEECFKRNGNKPGMAWRDLKDIHVETKKITKTIDGEKKTIDKDWTYYEMGPYKYINYPDLLKQIKNYSRGLLELGLKPNQESKLMVYAATSHYWMQSFLASTFQNIPIVTAYDTLGESGLTHSLVQTEADAIFTDNGLLGSLVKPLQKATAVKYIIHSEQIDPTDSRQNGKIYQNAKAAKESLLQVRPDLKFISFDEIIALGKEANQELHLPKPQDLACIMYTSGSTGDPKGVCITNKNLIAAVGGISTNAGRDLVGPNDSVIAFLPLAHIFELAFECIVFWWGVPLGYANVKTLTEASVRNCKPDLIEFQPTIMVGVAAVWESVRKGVLAKLKQAGYIQQKLFWAAFNSKSALNKFNIPGGSLFDVVFKKVKAATGGKLRYVLNGGSPISNDAQVFISTLIAPMLLGYGLTETCANGTIVEFRHIEYGSLGTLVGSVTAKLVDVEDAGYFAKNNQGEIYLKGGPVVSEYYKNEQETKEAFTEDGWFKTGDIGEWSANGALKIIDRKKNLVKTLNGEYIALEKLESIYRSNPVVQNICVYAAQSKVKPIAIIVPTDGFLKNLGFDEQTAYDDKNVVKKVLGGLIETGKSQGLKGIELLESIVLVHDEWTPANGFISSAQKLQRKKILKAYEKEIKKAYGDN
ncbi:long-chain fatty acid-CoA ligase [Lodderomyces elongisporus]|uniref:Long-chain-fatty-acid-CoA ligase 1 n=1 Tax=Lodderomyces elongisporus (strain ATCC 11503 / CBS 2605 / JCM 1781 / NBRC 1676 / NRRL YB-4239) TaxID=379508 RepID=A5E6P2_LODEL|nr:long-chain fatty acid-CoA ligase [Lodderomyces elongisporus]EDK47100.1 long-chain-fatty-acid-CoA ligase 1 [Lodderomyces elongisporus NRRL YB-4239]WLF78636.1 long-chain fatty acid-CoA ligase [Lodderomyces elongisporus]